jgi:hypothetical protein
MRKVIPFGHEKSSQQMSGMTIKKKSPARVIWRVIFNDKSELRK